MANQVYIDPIRGWRFEERQAPRKASPTIVGLAAFTIGAAIVAALLGLFTADRSGHYGDDVRPNIAAIADGDDVREAPAGSHE